MTATGTQLVEVGPSSRNSEMPSADMIFGRSVPMQIIRGKVEKVARAGVTVLIQGDSGTGKGLLALYLHSLSAAPGPFVKVNCAAIPGSLLESELFGCEQGAFTGATAMRPGRAEMANDGTLFLDGIDEMDMSLQAKLLQLLQDGRFCRVGGHQEIAARARVVCATGRRLEQAVATGAFRQDLYYRINVVNVELSSLRERKEDIAVLARYFLDLYQKRHGSHSGSLSASLLRLLKRHPWPGNIRELENLIERLVILGSEEPVSAELLQWEQTHLNTEVPTRGPIHLKKVTRQAVLELERKIILNVLEANRWNRKRAASELRISYRALLYKIRQAGLPPRRARRSKNEVPITAPATD